MSIGIGRGIPLGGIFSTPLGIFFLRSFFLRSFFLRSFFLRSFLLDLAIKEEGLK